MTRVDEDREAQRVQEQRAAEKKDHKRSQKQAEQFAKLIDSNRKHAAEQRRQQGSSRSSKHQSKLAAHSALLAKQGIQSNAFLQKLQQEGKARLEQGYETRTARKHELSEDRQALRAEQTTKREDDAQVKRQADKLAPISRDDRSNNRGDGFSGRGDGDSRGQNGPDVAFGGQGRGDGVDAAAGATPLSAAQQSHGASTTPAQMQQMIQEIVKHVMKGVDPGGAGVMVVELRDHVLGGASLTMKADPQGLSLLIRTPDENAARVLSAGQTAHELQQALQTKGIHLRALEVNDDKVIRS